MIFKKTGYLTITGMTVALLMGGCASSETYGPASSDSGQGYSDRSIEDGRFRVTYRGGDRDQARDGALRRAAEITRSEGGDWFQITNSYSDGSDRSGASVGVGGSTGSHRSGVGVGIRIPLGGSSKVEHSIEFVVGEGEKPASADAYNARSVLESAAD